METMTARELLAGFLRSRREMLRPEEAGIEPGPRSRRRTPGLRREEVALMSGVSVTWYTWLEQGRKITVSGQVLEGLARALRLSAAERRHLYTLAGVAFSQDTPQPAVVNPTLRALVETLDPNPAHVTNICWDLLAYNRAYEQLVGGLDGLPDEERNSIWLLFTRPSMRTLLVDWQREAKDILGQFRASVGRCPNDPRVRELLEALAAASPDFVAMWSEHPVQAYAPAMKRFQHPMAGRVTFNTTKLTVAEDHNQHLVVFLPASPTDAQAIQGLTQPAAGSAP